MESQIDINAEHDSSSYSGTFRWKTSKKLLSIPQVISNVPREFPSVDLSKGWKNYFLSRGRIQNFLSQYDDTDHGDEFMRLALNDLSMVDCLSFPISMAYLLREKNILHIDFTQMYAELNLLCIGCSKKAEERIAFETNVFDDLLLFFPNFQRINLWLIGPEMSSTQENRLERVHVQPHNHQSTLVYHTYRGGIAQFFQTFPTFKASTNTVMIGFNCGFANFANPLPVRYNLLLNWIYDLYYMTILQAIPFIGFCANDYEDLLHERFFMHEILGCYQITTGGENPFSMASTMVSETPSTTNTNTKTNNTHTNKNAGEEDYSRGNSFYYAIQGYDMSHRKKLSSLKTFLNHPNERNKQSVVQELLPYLQHMNNPNLSWRYREGKVVLSKAIPVTVATTTSTTTASSTAKASDIKVSASNQRMDEKESTTTTTSSIVSEYPLPPATSPTSPSTMTITNNQEQQPPVPPLPITELSSKISPSHTEAEQQVRASDEALLHITQTILHPTTLQIEVSSSMVTMTGMDIQMHASGLYCILQLPLVAIMSNETTKQVAETLLQEILERRKVPALDTMWASTTSSSSNNIQIVWNEQTNMYSLYQKLVLYKRAALVDNNNENQFSIQAKLKKKWNKVLLTIGCVE